MKTLFLSSGASHGAFQAGVLKALEELNWIPDLIIGVSVGAINGVGYVSGKTGDEMAQLWEDLRTSDVYRMRPWREWLKFWQWDYVLDTKPLEEFLAGHTDFDVVRENDTMLIISGTDVRTGDPCLFSSRVGPEVSALRGSYLVEPLNLHSILSSSAIPGIFPWKNGVWDGAFQQHHPLKPAVLLGATEIVVAHLNPEAEELHLLPQGIVQTGWRIVELASTYRLLRDVEKLRSRNGKPGYRDIDLTVICPERSFEYSKLKFDDPGKTEAIRMGYESTLKAMEKD